MSECEVYHQDVEQTPVLLSVEDVDEQIFNDLCFTENFRNF
jgi:hypothetical protein